MKSQLVIGLAVIGFIASSACTRSSGGSNPPPITQPPATAPTPVPNSQSELDGDSGKSAQDPREPQTAPSNGSRNNDDGPEVVNSPTAPSQTAPGQTAPPVNNGPEVIIYDPTGLTPSQIFDASRRQGPVCVGNESDVANGDSSEPLYYSGSGQDHLRDNLQTWVDTKTRRDRVQRDKDFAKKVSNGRFDVDWALRAVTLDLTIKGVQGPRVARFMGQLDNRLVFRGGDLLSGNHLRVEAACMDLNGGCQTVYALVQDGTGGVVRTAHMLIRQSQATLFTHADGFGVAHNPEFDSLLETLVRTDHHAGELNALNRLTLRTSETINGQSNFAVEMGIRSAYNTQQTLNLGGPLVKPATDIALNAEAQVLRSTSPAADTIRNVTLVNNDGRGTLTLAVTIRKATADAQEDTMELTISRIHKPVRPLVIK